MVAEDLADQVVEQDQAVAPVAEQELDRQETASNILNLEVSLVVVRQLQPEQVQEHRLEEALEDVLVEAQVLQEDLQDQVLAVLVEQDRTFQAQDSSQIMEKYILRQIRTGFQVDIPQLPVLVQVQIIPVDFQQERTMSVEIRSQSRKDLRTASHLYQ